MYLCVEFDKEADVGEKCDLTPCSAQITEVMLALDQLDAKVLLSLTPL